MQKLQALTAYLLAQNLVDREAMDASAEEGRLIVATRHTEEGLQLGFWKYQGWLSFERYRQSPTLLMAHVMAWLAENDGDRDGLEPPHLDADDNAQGAADVDLMIEFMEPILVVPDPDGPFQLLGQRWGLGEFDLWVAESVEVFHDADRPD